MSIYHSPIHLMDCHFPIRQCVKPECGVLTWIPNECSHETADISLKISTSTLYAVDLSCWLYFAANLYMGFGRVLLPIPYYMPQWLHRQRRVEHFRTSLHRLACKYISQKSPTSSPACRSIPFLHPPRHFAAEVKWTRYRSPD